MQHPSVKAKLGNRYICFTCGTKFYDLNRDPLCPECGSDQREAPVRDIRSILFPGKGKRKAEPKKEEEFEVEAEKEDDEDDETEDEAEEIELLGADGNDDDNFEEEDSDSD